MCSLVTCGSVADAWMEVATVDVDVCGGSECMCLSIYSSRQWVIIRLKSFLGCDP